MHACILATYLSEMMDNASNSLTCDLCTLVAKKGVGIAIKVRKQVTSYPSNKQLPLTSQHYLQTLYMCLVKYNIAAGHG